MAVTAGTGALVRVEQDIKRLGGALGRGEDWWDVLGSVQEAGQIGRGGSVSWGPVKTFRVGFQSLGPTRPDLTQEEAMARHATNV